LYNILLSTPLVNQKPLYMHNSKEIVIVQDLKNN